MEHYVSFNGLTQCFNLLVSLISEKNGLIHAFNMLK